MNKPTLFIIGIVAGATGGWHATWWAIKQLVKDGKLEMIFEGRSSKENK